MKYVQQTGRCACSLVTIVAYSNLAPLTEFSPTATALCNVLDVVHFFQQLVKCTARCQLQ